MGPRWRIAAGILSLVGDLMLVVGLVIAVVQGKPLWAILAVLGLILFEIGRVRSELVRRRGRSG